MNFLNILHQICQIIRSKDSKTCYKQVSHNFHSPHSPMNQTDPQNQIQNKTEKHKSKGETSSKWNEKKKRRSGLAYSCQAERINTETKRTLPTKETKAMDVRIGHRGRESEREKTFSFGPAEPIFTYSVVNREGYM